MRSTTWARSTVLMVVLTLLLASTAVFITGCSKDSGDSSSSSSSESTQPPSDVVKELQRELTELGHYTGSIDGIYGAATTKAVEDFQKKAGITVDGKYGPETHEALLAELGAEHSEATKHIQTLLADKGYYSGEINGKYDAATEAAVKDFQKDAGLTVDGIVGPKTLAALEAAPAKDDNESKDTTS